MQLIYRSWQIVVIIFIASIPLFAQNDNTENETNDPVEIDFLFNYYKQDGNHSAVDGGDGSQELTDLGPIVIINVPLKNNNLNINIGMDTYTSASSDNVDPTTNSGASRSDNRIHLDADYTFNNPDNSGSFGFMAGASKEFDYQSISFGAHWAKTFDNGNNEISLSGKVFFDRMKLIYPIELRAKLNQGNNSEGTATDSRRTYSLSTNYSFVISQNIQAAINFDLVYQTGYLSTPFHRVFFQSENEARVEKLPDNRFKIPLGLRFNYYISDLFVTRFHYRFYYDDFGITGNTFNFEVPFRVSNEVSFTPFYRFHKQTGADYFKPLGKFTSLDEFYTSDYDLSSFDSHLVGIGFKYYPLWGIAETGIPFFDSQLEFKRFDIRFASYSRSDGLDAYNVSFGISMQIK